MFEALGHPVLILEVTLILGLFYLALVLLFCCFFRPVKGPTYTAVLFLLHNLTGSIKMCSELILLMMGKEVVDHICDRGSTLNLLPESSQPSSEL